MSLAPTSPTSTAVTGLPGVAVISRIRRVVIVALIAALVYPTLMVASRGYCPGGFDGSGGFIDASGRPVDEAPLCVQLTLGPNPLVYLGIAAIVLLALGRVMNASDQAAALKTLNRASIGVAVLVGLAIVVSHIWFFMIPMEEFTSGSWTVFSPFPFGSIDVTTTPMSGE
ncbi:hypothetical protein [Microbacterium maritypicum]|uniref:Uncharacterized protein n=1 Tax=Microbacterium maritypicum MF109 TaxID=1333857 RepID=T5KIP1_MICMQ|nr:hypothetical protein [Microbacterium liquefaciens]EQM75847.1 hypothetical protein L687_02065 [Microbacterium maritypicum MF109]